MFQLVHGMRTRVVTSPSFLLDKILGAILFERTVDREVENKYTADYLADKGVVPLLEIDKGFAEGQNGARLVKPVDSLGNLLDRTNECHVSGVKIRSNILELNEQGIKDAVEQQFEAAKQITAKGLVPIIEPEVNINAKDKAEIERVLKAEFKKGLDNLSTDQLVMLKLAIPTEPNLYKESAGHPNVVYVAVLSSGYNREEASELFKDNAGLIASFLCASASDLRADQSKEEFDKVLGDVVESVYDASINKN